MKMKIAAVVVLTVVLVTGTVAANTIGSSTMHFRGTLSYGGTAYTGTVAMVDESALGIGDSIAGFDVYAKNGAWATYDTAGSGSQSYTGGLVTDHDAYNGPGGWGSFFDPDCADWYNYQLKLTGTTWALEYNGNVGIDGDLTNPSAAPMSGAMDWATGIATETDTGAYYTGMGTAESLGYAATAAVGTGQSTAGAWDMDWSWGSEFVPLEFPDFTVSVNLVAGTADVYDVTLTPGVVPVPGAVLLGVLGLGVAAAKLRGKRAQGCC